MDDIMATDAENEMVAHPGDAPEGCDGRRGFLLRAGVAAGGLMLGLAGGVASAAEGDAGEAPKAADTVVKLGEHQKLYQVGGAEVVDGPGGKVIVVHPDEATFVACAAICTHRGGKLAYDPATKQFACPLHGARFDLNGAVARGPAKQPLQSYTAEPALVVAPRPATPPAT